MSLEEARRRIAHVKKNNLNELDLSKCYLTQLPENELREIAPQLTTLNLAYNSIGEAGAKAIAGMGSLTQLDISDNSIGDAGAKAIAGMGSLTQLEISDNSIGEAGA